MVIFEKNGVIISKPLGVFKVNDYVGNRLNSRIPYKVKVKVKGKSFKEKEYSTIDISGGGIFVPSDCAPALGSPVEVKLYLPESKKAILLQGKVLRIKWAGNFKYIEGFAVEFKKVSREIEDKLLNFLNKVQRGEI